MATMALREARQLRNGDLVRWMDGIGVVRLEASDGSLFAMTVMVRPTERKRGMLGLGAGWKSWDELKTPVSQLDPMTELEVIGR